MGNYVYKERQLKFVFYSLLGITLIMTIYPFLVSVLGVHTGLYTPLKITKEVFLLATLLFLFVSIFFNPLLRHEVLKDKLNIAIAVYVALTLFFTIPTLQKNELEAAVSGFLMNTRFFIMFLTVQLILLLVSKDKVQKSLYKFIKYFLILSFLISIFAIMQVTILPPSFLEFFGYNGVTTPPPYSTVDNNINFLRAFSTMWAPNMLGAFLLLPLAIFCTLFLQKHRVIYTGIGVVTTCIAIFVTHSRSAIFGAIICIGIIVIIKRKQFIFQHIKPILIASALAIAIGASTSTDSSVRMLIFHSSETDTSLTEGSTNDHFIAIKENSLDVLKHPLGQGVGTAGPSSFQQKKFTPKIAENYFIQILQEVGIIGFLIFCYISLVIGWRLIKITKKSNLAVALFASFISINTINIFLHGWADDPTSITWWGFAAIVFFFPTILDFNNKDN
jgi:O-antigen ligase